jgi:hypothetical protein
VLIITTPLSASIPFDSTIWISRLFSISFETGRVSQRYLPIFGFISRLDQIYCAYFHLLKHGIEAVSLTWAHKFLTDGNKARVVGITMVAIEVKLRLDTVVNFWLAKTHRCCALAHLHFFLRLVLYKLGTIRER